MLPLSGKMNSYRSLDGSRDEMDKSEEIHQDTSKGDMLDQVCLGKHDSSCAIEILLDTRAFEKSKMRSQNMNICMDSPLYRPSGALSVNTNASTGGSSASEPRDDIDSIAMSLSAYTLPHRNTKSGYSMRRSRKQYQMSSASSLSSRQAKHQNESLGKQSISDIRKALKEMHTALEKSPSKGKKISRRTVIRGLSKMADTLEDPKERESLQKELEILMKKEKADRHLSGRAVRFSVVDEDKSQITEDGGDEPFCANAPYRSAPALFKKIPDEKSAAERVLDDLLWTEFVADRNNTTICPKTGVQYQAGRDSESFHSTLYTNSVRSESHASSLHRGHQVPRDRSFSKVTAAGSVIAKLPPPREHPGSRRHTQHRARQEREQPEKDSLDNKGTKGRSWWRRRPSSVNNKKVGWSKSSRSVQSDPIQQMYLPSSVTVRCPVKGNRGARKGFDTASLNSGYHLDLIDSESRYGYEMIKVHSGLEM